MKSFVTYLLGFLLLTACDRGQSMIKNTAKAQEKEAAEKAGIAFTYYSNGKIKGKTARDEHDRRHGESLLYYPSGNIKSKVTYDRGRRTFARQYYENGKVQMEFAYEDGMKEGVRKKYWDTGQLQSELPYHRNETGIGLVEYNRKGQQLTQYPTLEVRQVDRIASTGEFIVEVYFSEKPTRGTYYHGSLKDGKFKHRGLIQLEEVEGKGRMVFTPTRGTFFEQKIDFVGSYQTLYGNPYIVSTSINVAFEN